MLKKTAEMMSRGIPDCLWGVESYFLCQMDSKRMFLQEKKLNLLYFSISSPRPLRFTAVPSWALLHNTGDDYKKKTARFVIFKENAAVQ